MADILESIQKISQSDEQASSGNSIPTLSCNYDENFKKYILSINDGAELYDIRFTTTHPYVLGEYLEIDGINYQIAPKVGNLKNGIWKANSIVTGTLDSTNKVFYVDNTITTGGGYAVGDSIYTSNMEPIFDPIIDPSDIPNMKTTLFLTEGEVVSAARHITTSLIKLSDFDYAFITSTGSTLYFINLISNKCIKVVENNKNLLNSENENKLFEGRFTAILYMFDTGNDGEIGFLGYNYNEQKNIIIISNKNLEIVRECDITAKGINYSNSSNINNMRFFGCVDNFMYILAYVKIDSINTQVVCKINLQTFDFTYFSSVDSLGVGKYHNFIPRTSDIFVINTAGSSSPRSTYAATIDCNTFEIIQPFFLLNNNGYNVPEFNQKNGVIYWAFRNTGNAYQNYFILPGQTKSYYTSQLSYDNKWGTAVIGNKVLFSTSHNANLDNWSICNIGENSIDLTDAINIIMPRPFSQNSILRVENDKIFFISSTAGVIFMVNYDTKRKIIA